MEMLIAVAVRMAFEAGKEIVGNLKTRIVVELQGLYLKSLQIVGFVSLLDHLETLSFESFVSSFALLVEIVTPEIVEAAVEIALGLR